MPTIKNRVGNLNFPHFLHKTKKVREIRNTPILVVSSTISYIFGTLDF